MRSIVPVKVCISVPNVLMLYVALGYCGDYNELADANLSIGIEHLGLAKSSHNISNHVLRSGRGACLCILS